MKKESPEEVIFFWTLIIRFKIKEAKRWGFIVSR